MANIEGTVRAIIREQLGLLSPEQQAAVKGFSEEKKIRFYKAALLATKIFLTGDESLMKKFERSVQFAEMLTQLPAGGVCANGFSSGHCQKNPEKFSSSSDALLCGRIHAVESPKTEPGGKMERFPKRRRGKFDKKRIAAMIAMDSAGHSARDIGRFSRLTIR